MKTSNKLLLLFLGTIVFLMIASLVYLRFFGMQAGEKIQVSGVIKIIDRNISSFKSVEIKGPFKTTVSQGNESKLTITADEKIHPYITSDFLDNGTLMISIKKGYSLPNNSHISIQLASPEWKGITLTGSGELRSLDTLSGDFLDITSNGSGDIDLSLHYQAITAELNGSPELSLNGIANSLSLSSNGSGDIHALNLICQSVTFLASGSSDAELYADSTLDVTVNGSGEVIYSGNATDVRSRMNGNGRLVKK